MKVNNTIIKVIAAAIIICAGGIVASCSSVSEQDTAEGVSARANLAPESLAGKTLMIDHSQAQVAQIGVAAMGPGIEKKVFTPEWQMEYGWHSAQEMSGGQWSSSIITFTSDSEEKDVDGGKESYTYKKVSETEAILHGLVDYGEEFYRFDMKLKFITPTVAEAQYFSDSSDDLAYFFRHVRITIK